jgi:uncharacterized protein (TIGR03067 family)
MQGTWVAEGLDPEQEMKTTVKIEGDAMTVSIVTPSSTSRIESTLTLNEEARPRSLDIESSGSKSARFLGIYQLDGDTLTLRFGAPDGLRPTEWKAEGLNPISLLNLKRQPKR